MSDHDKNQHAFIGAAIILGLLSTLPPLLRAFKKKKQWKNHLEAVADSMMGKKQKLNKKLIIGGITGGVIGATAALLLAPKSGFDLVEDIYRPLRHSIKSIHLNSHKKILSHSNKKKLGKRDKIHPSFKIKQPVLKHFRKKSPSSRKSSSLIQTSVHKPISK